MCFKNNLGADLDFNGCYNDNFRDDEFLFSESVGRFIIETQPKDYNKIMEIAKNLNVNVKKVGIIIANPEIYIKGLKGKDVKLDVNKMKKLYEATIPNLMEI